MIRIYLYRTPYVSTGKQSDSKKVISAIIKPHKKQTQIPLLFSSREQEQLDALSAQRSIRRVRTVIYDITMCNDFDYFVTFTFDPKKINRYNPDLCKIRMSRWLHHQRANHSPDMKYLIVPEFHKDGAIHFHALIGNYNGKLKDSGKFTNSGRKIFNITSYRSGFSTAIPLDENIQAVASYIRKYITKDMPRFSSKKRYWTSTNLTRPVRSFNALDDQIKKAQKVYENERYELLEIAKSSTL